jgi:3,4-dihydroxy-2-butanone 4-phosphate synthase
MRGVLPAAAPCCAPAAALPRHTSRCSAPSLPARPAACGGDLPGAALPACRRAAEPLRAAAARSRRGRPRASGLRPAAVAPWHPEAPEPLDADAPTPGFASIPEALAAVAAGQFVVVMDDEDRENEGDLICAADKMTTEGMAFMVRHTSGVVCVALEDARADALGLPLMVEDKVRASGALWAARWEPTRHGGAAPLTHRPRARAGQRGEAAHRVLRDVRPEGARQRRRAVTLSVNARTPRTFWR